MPKISDGKKQILTSGYGTGLTIEQKNAVNIIQTPFIDIGQTWGDGAVGTGAGNKAYRQTDAITGLIITEVHIDLAGLQVKGSHAADAIGVLGNPAYIYQNDVANNGIIFKHELICTEIPASATSTITTDINIAWNASGTIQMNGVVGVSREINSGGLVAGKSIDDRQASIPADHYAYITEGDTSAANGTYETGQIIYRMYGYKVR